MLWTRRQEEADINPEGGIAYAAGRLYVDSNYYSCVSALSAATGRPLAVYGCNGQSYTRPPVVGAGVLYVVHRGDATSPSHVTAFATGCASSPCPAKWRKRWSGHVITGDVAVAHGRVYVPMGRLSDRRSVLRVLDAATGRQLWSWTGGAEGARVTVAGNVAYVSSEKPHEVYLLPARGCSASTCAPISTLGGMSSYGDRGPLSAASVAEGTVVVTSWHVGVTAFRLR